MLWTDEHGVIHADGHDVARARAIDRPVLGGASHAQVLGVVRAQHARDYAQPTYDVNGQVRAGLHQGAPSSRYRVPTALGAVAGAAFCDAAGKPAYREVDPGASTVRYFDVRRKR